MMLTLDLVLRSVLCHRLGYIYYDSLTMELAL
jgi:hypothetical protein